MMRKVCYFWNFLDGQQRWLNRMASQGYRLTECDGFVYTFEECRQGDYEYAVELVGDRTASQMKDYCAFLQEIGYRVLQKNINANISVGKVRWRPWAKGWAQIAASSGTFNKELLIVEKRRDGRPFLLHTDVQDALACRRRERNMYLWGLAVSLALLVLLLTAPGPLTLILGAVLAVFCLLWAVPTIRLIGAVRQLKRECSIND